MYQYRKQKFIAPEFIKKISSNEKHRNQKHNTKFLLCIFNLSLEKNKKSWTRWQKIFSCHFLPFPSFQALDFLFIKLYPSFTSNLPYSYIVKQVCALNHFKTEGSLYKKFTICWDHIEWNSNWRFILKSLPLQYMTAFLVPT